MVLGLVVGAVALALALWGVPLRQVGQALAGAQPLWLLPVGLIFMGQQALRAVRQLVMLRAVRPRISFHTSFSVLCISFLAIGTLPARLGEVVRPLLLLEREALPLGTGFALVFLERVFDLCATLAMLALVVWLVPTPSHMVHLGSIEVDWVALGRQAALTLLPTVLLAVLVLVLLGRRLLGWLAPLEAMGPRPWRAFIHAGRAFAGTFLSGLEAVRSPARLLTILVLTVVTWAASGFMYPFAARAFGLYPLIGYGRGIGVLTISMLGGIAPAPPGQAGTYEAFVRAALALYGVGGSAPPPGGSAPTLDAAVIAFALGMHVWILMVQAVSAAWFLAADRYDPRRLLRLARSGAWREELARPE